MFLSKKCMGGRGYFLGANFHEQSELWLKKWKHDFLPCKNGSEGDIWKNEIGVIVPLPDTEGKIK